MGIQISVKVSGETERNLAALLRQSTQSFFAGAIAGLRAAMSPDDIGAFLDSIKAGLAEHPAEGPLPGKGPPLRVCPPPGPFAPNGPSLDKLQAILEAPFARILESPHPGRALLHVLRSRNVFDIIAAAGGFPAAMVQVFGEALPADVAAAFQAQLDAAMLAESSIPGLERLHDALGKEMSQAEVEEQAKPNPPGADLARLDALVKQLAAASAALAGARAKAADRPPGIPEDTAAWARAIIAQASVSAQLPPEIIGE